MDIYQDIIIDHYKNPRNTKKIENPTNSAHVENSTCGDSLDMSILIENKIVKDISFCGSSCAISIASASILTDYAKGKNIDEILNWNLDTIMQLIKIPLTPNRVKCALLCLEALHKTLSIEKNL